MDVHTKLLCKFINIQNTRTHSESVSSKEVTPLVMRIMLRNHKLLASEALK